jgi:hypothetical protein
VLRGLHARRRGLTKGPSGAIRLGASSAPTSPAGDTAGGSGFVLLAIAIIVAGGLIGLGFAYGRRRGT